MAEEAFSVLIHKNRPTRTYTKETLVKCLVDTDIAVDFLKLCLEWNDSEKLKLFKAGLLFVIKSRGVSAISKATKMSRLSLYRMLSPKGNPRLSSLMAILRELKCHLWIVDDDFIQRREKVVRPKDIGKPPKGR
jgi:probable addiction module antidote protein